MRKLLLASVVVLFNISVWGQVETKFYSQKNALEQTCIQKIRQKQVIEKTMPSFDLQKLVEEDKVMDGTDTPFRFGNAFNVSYSLEDGLWQDVGDGRVWSMSFTSEGALSLNYVFQDFFLPERACMYIANKDETVLYGPVTSKDIANNSLFLTDIIPGSSSTIYIYEPFESKGESSLKIVRVVHGYRGVYSIEKEKGLGSSASCTVDVACHPEWQNEADAVAMVLLSNGDALCSGSLLMTTNLSFRPYFLTAFHCIDTTPRNNVISESESNEVESWLFKFNYKRYECGGDSIILGYTYNGASLKAAWYISDFALVEINHDLKQNSNLSWLGWDKTGNTPSEGTCIQHPQGDIMKISVDDDQITSSSWFTSNDHWHAEWDEGITQGGSSGSPLLNSMKRVVGQVHGKIVYNQYDLPCDRLNTDFGKLSLSWGGDGTNKLSSWLDSIGANMSYIDGARPSDIVIQPCGIKSYKIKNLPAGYTVHWQFQSGSTDLIQNLPMSNYCTIGSNNNYHNHETLVASIRKNGVEVTQRTYYIFTYNSLLGTYFQTNGDGTISIPETYFDNYDTLYVNPNCLITIVSSEFKNKTITYTGATLSSWNYDNDETVTLQFQWSIHDQNIRIKAEDACGCTYVNIVVNSNPLNGNGGLIPLFSYNQTSQSIEFNYNTPTYVEKGVTSNTEMDVEIINSSTGQLAYKGKLHSPYTSISTIGWTPGVYILRIQIGDRIMVYKITVK